MSLAHYAWQVRDYLLDNGFEYAEPDRAGGTFKGGIIMDLGGGQRLAFLLPTDDLDKTMRSLRGYLEGVYPGAVVSPPTRDGEVIYSRLSVEQVYLDGAA